MSARRLAELWRRLRSGRASRSQVEQTRYDDAARLEERTQAHYRSVTNSDSRGQSTGHNGSSQGES